MGAADGFVRHPAGGVRHGGRRHPAHFKQINDTRGHSSGDRALVLFSQALQRGLRPSDLAGRYGGEEFCVVLPMSKLQAAEAVDPRLREVVAAQVSPALGFPLGFSAGATELTARDAGLGELVARADRALYRARHAGRGRLVVDPASPAGPLS
ncbi:GGDEF domain-containing protein [Aquabacterium sp. A7-Y]|uniref:GGDEF domain-containing protein n=1 Tax=Aquabacterium sp. A7-Y TaxID=1349605 RepID=UPI00223D16D0|nr:GGDEF domain-containing protein [Aquabacterium sp. A7-Y]MCW7538394.1 GGDEF domain-containing protein [Aquabacterium sp. A7-Y]